mmetsp:Transcript_4597/g.7422  ORF Transcript_4597/g.7422 Transcript_4597/m.7422 type:complete len:224 (+) Transcript_4597:741-1412(+)
MSDAQTVLLGHRTQLRLQRGEARRAAKQLDRADVGHAHAVQFVDARQQALEHARHAHHERCHGRTDVALVQCDVELAARIVVGRHEPATRLLRQTHLLHTTQLAVHARRTKHLAQRATAAHRHVLLVGELLDQHVEIGAAHRAVGLLGEHVHGNAPGGVHLDAHQRRRHTGDARAVHHHQLAVRSARGQVQRRKVNGRRSQLVDHTRHPQAAQLERCLQRLAS